MAVKKKAVASKKSSSAKKDTAKKATSAKAAPKAASKAAPKAAPKTAEKKPAKPTVVSAAPPAAKTKPTESPAKPVEKPKAAEKVKTADKPKAAARDTNASGSLGIAPYEIKTGEDYMNDTQVKHFQNILRAWKRELMEEVDRTVHHMQDEAANFPDPNDRASQESEFTMELRARDRERKLIRKIDESLGKLEAGDYGYCEQCGIEIGVRRLEARPTATLYIDCKTLAEIKEKHVSG
jgi:DnaK suppressor protein